MLMLYLKVKDGLVKYKELTGIDIAKEIIPPLVTIAFIIDGNTAYAAKDVKTAFKPIIDTLKDLADPVCYGFMIKGFLQVMGGQSEKGKQAIKNAIGGYIGIQWIPWIFDMIREIGAR